MNVTTVVVHAQARKCGCSLMSWQVETADELQVRMSSPLNVMVCWHHNAYTQATIAATGCGPASMSRGVTLAMECHEYARDVKDQLEAARRRYVGNTPVRSWQAN